MRWVGEELWANRLPDWEIKNGTLVCNVSGQHRTVALLTHELKGSYTINVVMLVKNTDTTKNVAGIEVGRRGSTSDYRSAAIYGKGTAVGINTRGQLLVGDKTSISVISPEDYRKTIKLQIQYNAERQEMYLMALNARGEALGAFQAPLSLEDANGQMALLSDFESKSGNELTPSIVFKDLDINNKTAVVEKQHTFGPIFFAQYTLTNKLLKLSAQCAPTDLPTDSLTLWLKNGEEWIKKTTAPIQKASRVAVFKIKNWTISNAVPYRLTYELLSTETNRKKTHSYEGTIKPEPNVHSEIKLGLFGNNFGETFQGADLQEKMRFHNIDAALFLGNKWLDTPNESNVETNGSTERSTLAYLQKWYEFGWAYRDIFRTIPMISTSDGYDQIRSNSWIETVQQTQVSHLPDAHDPTPTERGISAYYTHWNWGPLNFAVLEDQKFKTPPESILPPEAGVYNGFITNPNFNIQPYNSPNDAELLGKRQERFLEDWATDWKQIDKLKIVLSQTSFASLATLHDKTTKVDNAALDLNTNGWPHNRRNDAVKILRKGFALHLTGGQSLASVIKYGVDEYNDANFAFTAPDLSFNLNQKRNLTLQKNKVENKGQYEDGFGNEVTIHAIANQENVLAEESNTGYGIIKINPQSKDITMECWPRSADPANGKQFDGWPVQINQDNNNNAKPIGYLPTVRLVDFQNPLIQLFNQNTDELIYAERVVGNDIKLKVFQAGVYRLKYGDPDLDKWQELKNLTIRPLGNIIRTKLFILEDKPDTIEEGEEGDEGLNNEN